MSSYLPEKCYVVCTNHMGTGYRQLERAGGDRSEFTVVFNAESRPWLTREDKKLNEDFNCKTKWSSPVAFAAFGAGLGTGVAIVAATGAAVGWIPVAGQIILGVVAVACIAYALYSFFTNTTKCSERLAGPTSPWIKFHQNVYFNGINAVNKKSILQCQEGGSLLPFISESLAADAARSIGLLNMADVGLNAVASAVSGLFLAFAAVPAAGVSALGALGSASGQFTLGLLFGKYIVSPLTEMEKEGIHSLLGGGEIYDSMNDYSDQNSKNGLANFIPDSSKNQLEGVDPSTSYYPDPRPVIDDLKLAREMGRQNGASQESINQLNEAIRSAERTGSFSPENNPQMRAVIENIKSGAYGDNVRRIFTNRSGNMRGMNRRANYERSIGAQNESMSENRTTRNNARGRAAGNLVQFFQPFISTLFSELARSAAAAYAEQDLANNAGFVAKDN